MVFKHYRTSASQHYCLNDGQAQPTTSAAILMPETLRDIRQLLRRNARPVITNSDGGHGVERVHFKGDGGPLPCMPQSVFEQISNSQDSQGRR